MRFVLQQGSSLGDLPPGWSETKEVRRFYVTYDEYAVIKKHEEM